MRLDKKRIYIGDVILCTEYDDSKEKDCIKRIKTEPYKERALLYRVDDKYIDLDVLEKYLNDSLLSRIKFSIQKINKDLMISTFPTKKNDLFLENLHNYYDELEKGKEKVKTIRKSFII